MQAPALAIGDGALGFWSAVRAVWPETRAQRDWCHKMGNVLDKLPKRVQPKAKSMLREIMYADDRAFADQRVDAFKTVFEAKHKRAVDCLEKNADELFAFFDFPAQHWQHIRTSNPIESAFSTLRLRQRVTKGAGSRDKALTMAFKLLEMAQQRWQDHRCRIASARPRWCRLQGRTPGRAGKPGGRRLIHAAAIHNICQYLSRVGSPFAVGRGRSGTPAPR
jgi:transposase-like protein